MARVPFPECGSSIPHFNQFVNSHQTLGRIPKLDFIHLPKVRR